VFWDRKGVLPTQVDTLKKLHRVIQNKRCGMLSRGVVMIRDNAYPHTAATTQDLIATFGWEQFDHPPSFICIVTDSVK
jgi:hypothetical protein